MCPLDRVLSYKNLIYLLNLQICIHIFIHGNEKYSYSYLNTFESIRPRPDTQMLPWLLLLHGV